MKQDRSGHKLSAFCRFVVADANGGTWDVQPDDFRRCPLFADGTPAGQLLKQFVANELTRKPDSGRIPKHVEYMQKHELLDYCSISEKGHYKWYPQGMLIRRLIVDYAAELARQWGAMEIGNPLLIRADDNAVGELMGEFHERDYKVDGGRGLCYLRYASDPGAFPFMQSVRFSRKHTPLKVYEETACFRNEQEGEVSGLKRVRAFLMTDMHAACASVEQARQEFEWLCLRFAALMNDLIAPGSWVLGWEGTVDFFEDNREWLLGLGRTMQVPAFFKLMPAMTHYYAIKNEYQALTEDGSNVQVSTVQWDVKDGARFNIGFTNEEGEKQPCPVIIHASSFGSIERTMCAILENIALKARAGEPPMFPLWLAPTQVRLIPVSGESLEFALRLCEEITAAGVRVDVDDRSDTVSKRVRSAEQAWVPYVAVLGPAEEESGSLLVRSRRDRGQREMTARELVAAVHQETQGMPLRPLAVPTLVSKRPSFT